MESDVKFYIKTKLNSTSTYFNNAKTPHAYMSTNLENTCISSCSLQDGPRFATNKVAHGVEF